MVDYIDCTNNLLQEALIKSLINQDAAGQYGIRTVQKTRNASAQTIFCSSNQHLKQLFQESLEIGTDGKVVLRIVIEAKLEGDGLTNIPDCATHEDLFLSLGLCFCTDTNGDTCLLLWNIT